MKKVYVNIFMVWMVFLFSSCSVFSSAESTPTAVPQESVTSSDPCGKDQILTEVEDLQALLNSFQEVLDIAIQTDVNLIVFPVLRLQEIQTELRMLKVPVCLADLKNTSLDYTKSAIDYLLLYMNIQDPESEEVNLAIQSSQVRWNTVLNDFNEILVIAGQEPQVLPEMSNLFPQGDETGIFASNGGIQAINIRSAPRLTSSIVSSLEPGMQAYVLGRTESGGWIKINLDGILGWVSAETVDLNTPIDQLPVVDTGQ